MEFKAQFSGKPLQGLAEHLIGGDAAGDNQMATAAFWIGLTRKLDGAAGAIDDGFDDGGLEAGAEISNVLILKWRDGLRSVTDGGLQSRK